MGLNLNTESKVSSDRLLKRAGLVALIAIIAFLMPVPFHSRLSNRFGDLVHLPAYVLITYLGIAVSDRYVNNKLFTRLLATLAIVSVSGFIELLQAKLGRTASLQDLITNGSGATVGLFVHLSAGCESIAKRFIRLAGMLIFLFIASSPLRSMIDIARMEQFPAKLGMFTSSTELERWYIGSATAEVVTDNSFGFNGKSGSAVEVTFYPHEFPAIQLRYLNTDWTDYETLTFDLARSAQDTTEPLLIQLRISDRFNRKNPNNGFVERYNLAPGERKQISIPVALIASGPDRTVDIDRIRFVEFMAVELKTAATIRLANLQLHVRTGDG